MKQGTSRWDRWDSLGLLGALLVAGGLWFVWPPAILFWLGLVSLTAGVLGAR